MACVGRESRILLLPVLTSYIVLLVLLQPSTAQDHTEIFRNTAPASHDLASVKELRPRPP
ncbi:hypothetical protein E2C01_072863 [Portunus trituberculatus]|uniref:Uncharacterized protein n=1 Tax=Portunus trituberculatus TaxID=210409 RepID=A0A5B7IBT9_PORTR|nr:hypothetical protein [Portunus trituberculatus]